MGLEAALQARDTRERRTAMPCVTTGNGEEAFFDVFQARSDALSSLNARFRVELAALLSSARTGYLNSIKMPVFPSGM